MSALDYRGARAMVLGASGFIGRWVARRLTAEGAAPILVVRNPVTVRGETMIADLAVPGVAARLIGQANPDIVFNLAGYGVDPTERDEALSYRMNAELVEEVADACAGLPSQENWRGLRLVHAGSVLEYGAIQGIVTEDSLPNPTTLYGRTKLAGTTRLTRLAQQRGLPAVTARLLQVVGPGEHPGRLLPLLLKAARHPDSAPIPFSHGAQRHDFTYVEDVAEGLLRLGQCPGAALLPSPGKVVNLGTGFLSTAREFIETAATILGIPDWKLQFGALPSRTEEMQYEAVRVERLRLLLDWLPNPKIEDIVHRSVRFLAEVADEN